MSAPGDNLSWKYGCKCPSDQRVRRVNPHCPMHGRNAPKRTVIQGDCREALRMIPSNSVDLIVTDPAYPTISSDNSTEGGPISILSKNDGKIFEHNNIAFDEYMGQLYRVLKSPGHIYIMTNFLNLQKCMESMQNANREVRRIDKYAPRGFRLHNLLVWQKNNATPNRWFMKNAGYTVFGRKGAARPIYTPGEKTVTRHDSVVKRDHPTEKTIDWMLKLVRASAKPGDTVLDPFCGAGVIGQAAMYHGCNFIGIEIDPKHAATTRSRLQH